MSGRAFTDSQRDRFRGGRAHRDSSRARRSRADLDADVEVQHSLQAKQRFDVIVQPGVTFRLDPSTGYQPLLKDRPMVVIVARVGDFITGMNRGRRDMATPCLREVLRFIGVSDVRFVPIGPTTGPAALIKAARQSAHRRLGELAA